MQVRVECIEKIDTDSLSVDCSVTQCRGIETAMRKTPHRMSGNEPLRMVHQVQGQEGSRRPLGVVTPLDFPMMFSSVWSVRPS